MSYAANNERVLWNGKAIKGADAATFERLSDTIGRDADAVYVLGKPVKLDVASFEVLGLAYARDRTAVYLIMGTKLKPLKDADPASFRVLGESYGVDANRAFHLDRSLRLGNAGKRSLTQFLELAPHYATDGSTLYHKTRPLEGADRLALDWSRTRIRILSHEPCMGEDIALSDGEKSYYLSDFGLAGWIALEAVAFAGLRRLEAAPSHPLKHAFATDGRRVLWRGQRVVGADALTAKALSRDVVADANAAFAGVHRLPFHSTDMTYLSGDLFAGRHGEVFIGPEGLYEIRPFEPVVALLAARSTQLPRVQQALDDAYTALINATLHLLDHSSPNVGNVTLVDFADLSAPSEPLCRIKRKGADVALLVGSEQVAAGPISDWYGHICRLWSHLRGRRDKLVCFSEIGVLLPSGSSGRRAVLSVAWIEVMSLAGALFREGEEQEARILAHEVLYAHKPRHRLGVEDAQPFADLPPPLVHEAHYRERHHSFTTTTNSAVARHILASGLLADPDWRVRLEMMRTLNGVTADTHRHDIFLVEIVPALVRRYPHEAEPLVREALLGVIEMAAARFNDRLHEHAPEAEKILQFLLNEGVNVELNTARLQQLVK